DNFDAYTFYLSGRSHQARLSPSELNSAIADFRKAIELDPNYALAYTGIADSYRALVLSGEYAPAEMIKKSNEAAETAVTLDPQLAEAHSSVGFNRFWFYRDWAGAEEAMKRSLEIDPKLATGHLHYAHLLSNIGRNDEAIAEAEKVRSLAGYDPFFATLQGMVYQHAGQFETALARFKLASDLDENLWLPHMFAAVTYLDARRYDQEAFDSARKATELNHSQSISPAYEVVALVRLGRNDEAKRILEELLKRSEYKYVPSYHLAIAYVGIDDRENALKWIEKSVAEQDPKIVFLKVDHIWDPLRSEPRFIALMRKMNFPEQK
ncbi:MAG TPA: hypothetical protein VJV05_00915, partial [Pyrinomonadaceae bacterium]|nr:hypothetical protein [Pyrinomonadaceae bacterium]